jgi:hypothetical protein
MLKEEDSMKALPGFIFGLFVFIHWSDTAYAWTWKAVTSEERVGSVLAGIVLLAIILYLVNKRYNSSFFNGFLAAVGLFLTVDNILFHWIFQLHRMTSGPEADILEPLFVLLGFVMVLYTWRKEGRHHES